MGSQIRDAEDYDEILSRVDSDQIGITVDTGHFHTAGVDVVDLICRYPDRIWNVHLKDHVGAQSVPIGAGEIDLPGLIAVLAEVNYDGFLALELEVQDPENAPRYVEEAYQYLSGLLG